MAGLCLQPMITQLTCVQPMTSQLCTVIKPQVSIILGYAIERELEKSRRLEIQYCRRSETKTTALKDADYNTFEEVHGRSVTGSTRRIDITAFKESTRSGFTIDPTVRFETNEEQPAEVDNEKNNIYNPTVLYYLQNYQLKELEVIGLLVGARGTATLFMKDVFKRLGIHTSIIPVVTLAALKESIALLKYHLYSKSN
ncbi:hypothetical protein ANN_05957 [Periplaneta americana]|uniref:Uncharacterized protein n=1 Tax=Periplaneta americana TaxID=6978 RepID=A0ABQ8TE00_PERAM|nr:hypothetical protein ANN_05957 [Periplaneta americana]